MFDTMKTFIDEILDWFVKEGWLLERGEGDATAIAVLQRMVKNLNEPRNAGSGGSNDG